MRLPTLLFSTLFAVVAIAVPQNFARPNQGNWDSKQAAAQNFGGDREHGQGSWPTASWSARPTYTDHSWPTHSVTRGPWNGPEPTDWPGKGWSHEHGGGEGWSHEHGEKGEQEGSNERGSQAWGGEKSSQGWKRARVNDEARVLEI